MLSAVILTPRMSYRRRETRDVSIANPLSKTERLAAVSSIRLVELSRYAAKKGVRVGYFRKAAACAQATKIGAHEQHQRFIH